MSCLCLPPLLRTPPGGRFSVRNSERDIGGVREKKIVFSLNLSNNM